MPALTGNVYEMANKTGGLDLKNILQPGERYQTYLKDKESYNQTQAKRLGIELPEQNTQPQTAEPSPFESRIQSALDTVRLWRGPDYVFTDAESKTLETLLSGSDNPDEVFSRFISSTALAGMSGYDVKTVYDNLDQISQFYTGKDYMANDATLFEKVNASFKTIQAQKIMAQYKDAYVSGDYEKASEYEAQAQTILDEIGDTLAGVPQSTLDAIGNTLFEQAGYLYTVIQSGGLWSRATYAALTALVAVSHLNPISAGIAYAAVPVSSAAAANVGSISETTRLAEAQSFWDLMHDPETPANPAAANVLSLLNGLFVGATETFLDGISSRGINKIAGKKLNQLGVSMLVDSLATRGSNRFAYSLLDWVTGGVDEALLNEFPQQVWDYMTGVAYRHMSGVPANFDFGEMMSESFKAAADGLLVGLVYGGLGIPLSMREYNNLSLELRRKANSTYSREEFFKLTADLKPESISASAYKEAQSKIWDASVIQRDEYMAKNFSGTVLESMEIAENELFAMTDKDGNPRGVPDGSVNRTAQGRLFAQEDARPAETTVYFGDPDQKTFYGAVSFSEYADSVKINSVRVSPGYESLRPEMMTQIFSDYGFNKTIEWNPTTKGLQAVKQSLIDNNPDKTGLNYKAYSTKANTQTLADQIQKNMPSLSRPEALVSSELYLMADRGALSATNKGQIFGNAAADGIDLQWKRGATNIAKSVIYAAKNADVSTFTHELFHATAAVRPAEKKELTDAVKNAVSAEESRAQLETFIKDHQQIWGNNIDGVMKSFEDLTENWNREQEENLARLYEAYRSSTQSQRASLPEKIKEALRRLADYISRIYQTVKDTVPLNEDIAKAFDRITGIEKPSSKTGRPEDGVLYQDAIDRDFRTVEEDLRKEKSNFDDDGKHLAPNGKPSNLPYRQWVMVRTPAFKNWFGDWEQNPTEASKVVDENGEPLIVYHGSSKWFRVFNNGKEQHHSNAPDGAIFTTDNRDVANSYVNWYGPSAGQMPPQAHDVYLDENDSRHSSNGDYIYREGGIYPLFLNIRKPFTVDFNGRTWQSSSNDILEDADINDYASWAREDGYDGLIAKNIIDVGITDLSASELPSATDYVAFESTQAKSIDNLGTFDGSNPDILFQDAYHGSPHSFDRFSTDYIGTGEGNQTFGWGLYFTNAQNIAEGYASKLVRRQLPESEQFIVTYDSARKVAEKDLAEIENLLNKNPESTQGKIDWLAATRGSYSEEWLRGTANAFHRSFEEHVNSTYERTRSVYETNLNTVKNRLENLKKKYNEISQEIINDKGSTYLESLKDKTILIGNRSLYTAIIPDGPYLPWLERVSPELKQMIIEQAQKEGKTRLLRNAEGFDPDTGETVKSIELAGSYMANGKKIYEILENELGSPKEASLFLKRAGIVGIEYQAGTLSGVTDSTATNYVVFDADDIKITDHVRYQDDFDRTRYSGLFRRADEPASEIFDPATPQQAADAADYMSPPDYPDFYDVPDDGEYFDDLTDPAKWDSLVKPEDLGIKQDADYTRLPIENQMGYTYEEAVAATLPDVRYVGSDSAKDAQFIEAMDDSDAFYRYMYLLGESLNLNRNGKNGYRSSESARIQIEPYIDQRHREQIQAMANSRVSDVDVREVSKAWNIGQDIDPARVEIARKQIKKNARIWRDFFADLTGNKDMKPNTLIEGRLDIQAESQGNYRSIDELAKIAQEAGFAEVEAKLKNGTLKMNDVDTDALKRIKEQITNLRRQYNATTKANAKLNDAIKDLKSTLAEQTKERAEIDKRISNIINLLNENVPYNERLKISDEYVKLTEELNYLEHGYDEIFNTFYKPTDGRTARGHKEMRRRQELADHDWRKGAKEKYGLNNLNEIKARKKEISEQLEKIRLKYAVDISRRIGSQIDRLNARLQEAQQAVSAAQNASSADHATISQLNKKIEMLREELREEKNTVNNIKRTENLQVANLKRQVARLKNIQANYDEQIERTVGRMEAQYESMLKHAQNQRDQIIEKQRQQRALDEIKAEKASLAKEIMEPVNLATTDWETGGQAIMAIQAMIDPEFRRDWIYALDVNLRGEARKGTMTIPEAQNYFAHLDDEGRQAVIEALSPQVIARLTGQRKPLNDWTVEELRGMADEVYKLRKLGRETLRAKNAFLQEQAKYTVKSMLEVLRPMAGDKLRNMSGSQESLSHAKSAKTKISQILYSSRRPQELAQLIDGGYGKQGAAYNLLIDEKRYHQNRALRKMDERFASIDPLVTKETAEKLAKTHKIDFGDGYSQTFTLDDLAYIYLSQYEMQNRAAVAFGTLITQEEKGTGIPRGLDENGRPMREYLTSSVIADDEVLERVGWDRYNKALNEAHMILEEEGLMDFVSAIEKDLNSQGERLQRMMVTTFNQPIHLVEHYLPIRRKDLTGENLDLSADAVLNYGNSTVMHNPEKGFTVTRVNVPPRQQTPVNTSLLSVWRNAVRQQEWLIESAAYIKKLHRIFNNKEFQNALQGAYSPGLYREITDYIDLIANPYKQPRKTGSEKAFRALRGNLAAAYLGWKASGIITQAITSPMPFLTEISPARLIKAYMDIAEDYSSVMAEIDDKSPMMKNRSMSFVVEELAQRVLDAGNNKAIENWYKFTQTGMKGLEWIDRVAVAGGWLAKYQETLESGLKKGLDTDSAENAAIKAADDFVLKFQPTGDKTEYASMFRTENEFAKAILQFTTSLNVIWNNITADLQGYLRNKEYGKVAGMLSGYILAGLLLGVVLTGYDDDDNAVDKARKTGYFALTQFMDSVPWIGSMVNETLQHVITGERDYYGTSSLFPAAQELLQTLDSFSSGNFAKGFEKLGKGIGLVTGVPTSMLGQLKNAIVDGDPWKLLGRQ